MEDKNNKAEEIIYWVVGVVLFIFVIAWLSGDSSSESYDDSNYSDYSTEEDYEYEEDNTFNGYTCTDDCSGHEAGYEWAEERDITQDDVDGYGGSSNSFQEGMQSWVDENY